MSFKKSLLKSKFLSVVGLICIASNASAFNYVQSQAPSHHWSPLPTSRSNAYHPNYIWHRSSANQAQGAELAFINHHKNFQNSLPALQWNQHNNSHNQVGPQHILEQIRHSREMHPQDYLIHQQLQENHRQNHIMQRQMHEESHRIALQFSSVPFDFPSQPVFTTESMTAPSGHMMYPMNLGFGPHIRY
jgi:hypothetical protein